jgi:hypothetical protein
LLKQLNIGKDETFMITASTHKNYCFMDVPYLPDGRQVYLYKQNNRHMKRFLIHISIAALAFCLLYSCKPEELKPVGDPFDKAELMVGTWDVTKVTQVDVDATLKGYPLYARELDITNVFPNNSYTDVSITLNSDQSFALVKGNAFVNWPVSGTWELNHPDHPSKLYLVSQFDTLSLNFSSFSDLMMSPAKLVVSETKKQKVDEEYIEVIYYNYEISKP